jgi:predicted Zn-ribbon and HTH transcriptional regulator
MPPITLHTVVVDTSILQGWDHPLVIEPKQCAKCAFSWLKSGSILSIKHTQLGKRLYNNVV